MTQQVELANPLPIDLADGLIWLGVCVKIPFKGEIVHSGDSLFMVVGEKHCALIEGAYTYHAWEVLDQLEALIKERNLPPLKYVCVTHSELAHAGGVGHIMTKFPDVTVCGEVSDLHLIFPQFADRLVWSNVGDRLDLGGREVVVVDGVVRDMPYSRWFFDTGSHTLFSGDGFAYAHEHNEEHCGHFVEQVPELDIPVTMESFARGAFNFLEYIDIEPTIARLDAVIKEFDVVRIAPTHGLPIGDPEVTMVRIREGYRRASQAVTVDLYA
jgi:flavorubredoxin